MDLTGKTALVTGAGRGLGWGIARALADAGAKVCVTDINEADITRSVGDIETDGNEAYGVLLDVSNATAFKTVVDDVVTRWGRLDVLVHNAVYMPLESFEATTPDDWWRQIDVGLGGLYNGTRAVWETMKARGGGHIIGIASGSSVRGYKDEVAYCALKHAQEGFVKALALEAANFDIALNTVGPGKPIKTTRLTWEELAALPEAEKQDWADPVALGRAFVWLASQPPARFTGLRFDAGPIVDTLEVEGAGFEVAPEKVTLYVDDFEERQRWFENYESSGGAM
ncbi:SDR family NAD(P)-dependent oxidoreductase [soil metagenome]